MILSDEIAESILDPLRRSTAAIGKLQPGAIPDRQPIHTVYGGAHLFKADVARKFGALAMKSLETYAPTPSVFARALRLGGTTSQRRGLYERVVEKLKREPVEDYRIDFEDGYGYRPDEEEDVHARRAALEMAEGLGGGMLPPFVGIRIKPLTENCMARAVRTLDIFISTLLEAAGGHLPERFVVTLPKVSIPDQVRTLVKTLMVLEQAAGLRERSIGIEVMIEAPELIINRRGECVLPSAVQAADGRCIAVHFGPYDYAASLDIAAPYQTPEHRVCAWARRVIQVALAGTGIWLADGPQIVLPIPPHRGSGKKLTANERRENRESVHRAWLTGFGSILDSMRNGYYQGWDLHPAQLPVRYAAVYTFFDEGLALTSARLKALMADAQTTMTGGVFDDAATGQGLVNFFRRGINCGAVTAASVAATGLIADEIRSGSYLGILRGRQKRSG